jgi:hypothetical protein
MSRPQISIGAACVVLGLAACTSVGVVGHPNEHAFARAPDETIAKTRRVSPILVALGIETLAIVGTALIIRQTQDPRQTPYCFFPGGANQVGSHGGPVPCQ